MFNIGDTVRLRSGGAVMTVCGTVLGHFDCRWHVCGEHRNAVYPENALVLVWPRWWGWSETPYIEETSFRQAQRGRIAAERFVSAVKALRSA